MRLDTLTRSSSIARSGDAQHAAFLQNTMLRTVSALRDVSDAVQTHAALCSDSLSSATLLANLDALTTTAEGFGVRLKMLCETLKVTSLPFLLPGAVDPSLSSYTLTLVPSRDSPP
jgi:hypothetical protein